MNADNVTYKGDKPVFEQYGPYIYREYDSFTNITYEQQLPVHGRSDSSYSGHIKDLAEATGLTAIFN